MAVEFLEESAPILIAPDFNLRDYDSPDALSSDVTVTLTLAQTQDEDSEGIMAEVTGDVIMTELETADASTKQYSLSNGSSLILYEEVGTLIFSTQSVHFVVMLGSANIDVFQQQDGT